MKELVLKVGVSLVMVAVVVMAVSSPVITRRLSDARITGL